MKIFYCFLLAAVCTTLKAQLCEPRFIELNLPTIENQIILQGLNNTYIIIGVKNESNLFFAQIESEGKIVQTTEINYTDTLVLKEAAITKDGNILVITNHYKNKKFHESRVLKLDNSGNQIWENIVKDIILTNFAETTDNQFFLIGDNFLQLFPYSDCSIVKLNNNGQNKKIIYFSKLFLDATYTVGNEIKSIAITSDYKVYFSFIEKEPAFTRAGIIGKNYLATTDTSFKNISYIELPGNSDHVSENHFIKSFDSSKVSITLKPNRGFLDGNPSLYLSYIIENNKLIENNEIYNCGQIITNIFHDTDTTNIVLGNNKIFRYNKDHKLLSQSSLRYNSSFLLNSENSKIIKDGLNQFSFIVNSNNKTILVKYDYFGHDCKTKIYGTVFYDQNKNCNYEITEKPLLPLEFFPSGCENIFTDKNGYFEYIGEYGLNVISFKFNNKFYSSQCLTLNKDSVIVKYSEKDHNHNIPVQKNNNCFQNDYYQYNETSLASGGNLSSTFKIFNHSDSTLRNIKLHIIQNPQLIINGSQFNFTQSNDTLTAIIDSIRADSLLELNIISSIDCKLPIGAKINQNIWFELRDPCMDTISQITFNIRGTISNANPLFQNLRFNPRRPCTLLNYSFTISNSSIESIKNICLEITRDPALINISVSHPYIVNNNNFVFKFDSIPGDSTLAIEFSDSISCQSRLGDQVCLNYKLILLRCDSIQDTIIVNNCRNLRNSLDPNYIISDYSYNNKCFQKSPPSFQISYYVQFQNEGNDTAINVLVYDTISNAQFDINSFIADQSFSPYKYRIIQDSIIEFSFVNINLPPKSIIEYASKHEFKYLISAKLNSNNLINGNPIQKRVGVVFDSNPPVATELDFIYPCFTTNILNQFKELDKNAFEIIPNPTSGKFRIQSIFMDNTLQAEIFNQQGIKIQSINNLEIKNEITLNNCYTGIFYLRLITNKSIVTLPFTFYK